MATMEFKDGGTVDLYFMDQLAGTATYKVDGDKITMTSEGQTESGTFKIEGNKLTLTNSGGETQVYVKE
jgi:heat shock protein HslJ